MVFKMILSQGNLAALRRPLSFASKRIIMFKNEVTHATSCREASSVCLPAPGCRVELTAPSFRAHGTPPMFWLNLSSVQGFVQIVNVRTPLSRGAEVLNWRLLSTTGPGAERRCSLCRRGALPRGRGAPSPRRAGGQPRGTGAKHLLVGQSYFPPAL